MADETVTPVVEATNTATDAQPTGADPGTKTEAAKTFTQAELDAIVKERLERAERKATEATKKATEAAQAQSLREQGEFKTLFEQAQAKLQEAEQRAKALEIAGIRRDVAARLQLPVGLVDRLRGDTDEEITADAQALLAALPKPAAPNINAGDVGGKTQTLPGGITEAALREQAVRLNVPFEAFKAQFLRS